MSRQPGFSGVVVKEHTPLLRMVGKDERLGMCHTTYFSALSQPIYRRRHVDPSIEPIICHRGMSCSYA